MSCYNDTMSNADADPNVTHLSRAYVLLEEAIKTARAAGEMTAWLAPKMERVLFELAHVPARTAEDERRDVLAFLTSEVARLHHAGDHGGVEGIPSEAYHRWASALQTAYDRINHGDHEGASTR